MTSDDQIKALIRELDERDEKIAMLREALGPLLLYTEACENLLNASESGQVRVARNALDATAQPEPTLEEMIDSGLVDPGLVAAWEASEYTEYGDEGELPELIRESYRSATAQPEQDGGWLPMESAPRDGRPVWLKWGVARNAHQTVEPRCWNPECSHLDGTGRKGAWIGPGGGFVVEEPWFQWAYAGWPAPPTHTEAEGEG